MPASKKDDRGGDMDIHTSLEAVEGEERGGAVRHRKGPAAGSLRGNLRFVRIVARYL